MLRRHITLPIVLIAIAIALSVTLSIVVDKVTTYNENSEMSNVALDMKTVIINGERYVPKNIDTYIFLGVDKFDSMDKTTSLTEQADFIFYLIINHTTRQINFLHINRDSMVKMKRLSSFNDGYIGDITQQICLSHTYGSTEELRVNNTIDAVRNMFTTIPVDNRMSFNMSFIEYFTDLVGGVTITIDEESADENLGLSTGDVIELDGTTALSVIRARNQATNKTNLARMKRQRLYLKALFDKLTTSEISAGSVSDSINDHYYTDMTSGIVNNLLSKIKEYSVCPIQSLSGENVLNEDNGTVEYYVSQDSIDEYKITYLYDRRDD